MKLKSQAKNKTATPAASKALAMAAQVVVTAVGLTCALAAPAAHAQAGAPGSLGNNAGNNSSSNASNNASNNASGLALAQQQNCMSCHSVTRTFMGPALRDVAAKYASRPEAQTYLSRKIMEGSAGVWGMVPMPANTQLNPGQAAMLASWILTLK